MRSRSPRDGVLNATLPRRAAPACVLHIRFWLAGVDTGTSGLRRFPTLNCLQLRSGSEPCGHAYLIDSVRTRLRLSSQEGGADWVAPRGTTRGYNRLPSARPTAADLQRAGGPRPRRRGLRDHVERQEGVAE